MVDYFYDGVAVPAEDGLDALTDDEWEELRVEHRRALFMAYDYWGEEDEEEYAPRGQISLDDFEYDNETSFERGDFGELIVYLMPDERRVILATSKQVQGLTMADSGLPSLRRYLNDRAWISHQVGYHKEIPCAPGAVVLGGASYFAFDFDTIFVDSDSGGFGPVSLDLVRKCLHESEIVTMRDRKYFATKPAEEILSGALR